MEGLTKFFKDHWQVMLIGLIGVIIGVVLNTMMRKYENGKFLDSLTVQLKKLEEKSISGPLSRDEEKMIERLKDEIFIMKFKCES